MNLETTRPLNLQSVITQRDCTDKPSEALCISQHQYMQLCVTSPRAIHTCLRIGDTGLRQVSLIHINTTVKVKNTREKDEKARI